MSKKKWEQFESVWDTIAETPGEAANLELRYVLMEKIAGLIEQNGWTQAVAAKRCGVSQPRVEDLLRGRISQFSLDALVNIVTKLGRKVKVRLEAA